MLEELELPTLTEAIHKYKKWGQSGWSRMTRATMTSIQVDAGAASQGTKCSDLCNDWSTPLQDDGDEGDPAVPRLSHRAADEHALTSMCFSMEQKIEIRRPVWCEAGRRCLKSWSCPPSLRLSTSTRSGDNQDGAE